MPLYMDFHKFEKVTVDDVKTAHIADQAIQDKYGVRYLQFWVNEAAGTVFCLTEGPDKASCELVHKMAHGNTACALVEVEPGFYKKMMGDEHDLDHGLVKKEDGTVDLGYRTILFTRINLTGDETSANEEDMVRHSVSNKIDVYRGRTLRSEIDNCVIGVFNDPSDALDCAIGLHTSSKPTENKVGFRIGITTDQPVTLDGEFFSQAIQQANQLSLSSWDNYIMITNLTKRLCRERLSSMSSDLIQVIDETDLALLKNFLTITENHLSDEAFTIDELCRELGLSRPQLYRKITAVSGRAPNDFVRDIRMEHGWNLLKRKKGNISQVALEVGYNNPSYFTKCFAERFGITPSKFLQLSSR